MVEWLQIILKKDWERSSVLRNSGGWNRDIHDITIYFYVGYHWELLVIAPKYEARARIPQINLGRFYQTFFMFISLTPRHSKI